MALWGKIDNEESKPKFLSDELRNDQSVSDKDATVGIDRAEAQEEVNRLKAIKTPGWTKYRTYTDTNGNTRHKAEVLVAFGGDFTTGDSDAFPPNPVVSITTQPQSASVFTSDTATFTATATATRGADVNYQWQEEIASEWVDITGATSDTLSIEDTSTADDGREFRVVVSVVGTSTATSDVVTLTVADAAITIDTQPANETVDDGDPAEFTVAASITGDADLSYQWEVSTNAGVDWTEITDATDATLTVESTDDEYVTDNQFRVVVTGTKGATPVTSDTATLTIVV